MMCDSKFTADVLGMRPIDFEVIDCHGHLGGHDAHYIPFLGSAESIISMMDMVGIKQACVSHMLSVASDHQEGNRIAYESTLKYPNRLLIYLGYNPNYSEESNKSILEKYVGKKGVIGLKLHTTFSQVNPDDARFMPAYELAREMNYIILCHTWGTRDIIGIEKVARLFPDVEIIAGHSGGFEFSAIYEALRVAKEHDNVYLDLTCSVQYNGLIELYVREVSANKVLYGSDIPYIDPRQCLGSVVFAGIPDVDKERILGGNMKMLLKRNF